MEEVYFFKVFNLMVGVVGLAIGLGVLLTPRIVAQIEKRLDRDIPTDKLEKILNERKNISEILLRHPKIFGSIVMILSFLLVMSSVYLF